MVNDKSIEDTDGRIGAADQRTRWRIAFAVGIVFAASALPAISRASEQAGMVPASLVLAPALIALTVIDIEEYRLPDALTLPLLLVGLVLSRVFAWDDLPSRVLAAVLGYTSLVGVDLAYRYLRGRAGLGHGDAKLLAAAGAWVGIAALPSVVLIGAASALVAVAGAVVRGHRVSGTTMLPFGPFLAFGFWLVWLYGAV